jgi:hypothetical protein
VFFIRALSLLKQKYRDFREYREMLNLENRAARREIDITKQQHAQQEEYSLFRASLLSELDKWFYQHDAARLVVDFKPGDDGLSFDLILDDPEVVTFYEVTKLTSHPSTPHLPRFEIKFREVA